MQKKSISFCISLNMDQIYKIMGTWESPNPGLLITKGSVFCVCWTKDKYLTSKLLSNKQCSLVFALKGKKVWGVKDNFQNMYSNNTLCSVCERSTDTHNQVIQCKILQDIMPCTKLVQYSDIEGSLEQQKAFIETHEKYLSLRDEIL